MTSGPDGYSDDLNADKVPDLYPTLYPNVLATGLINAPNYLSNYSLNTGPFQITSGLLAFPYIFRVLTRSRRSSRPTSTGGSIRRARMPT